MIITVTASAAYIFELWIGEKLSSGNSLKLNSMKIKLTMLTIALLFASCNDRLDIFPGQGVKQNSIKIAVVSDIHYMDPSLLANGAQNGEAFQNYLNADPKLIEYSDAIARKMIGEITTEKPQLVLIPGDLTKDGERVSHESIVELLQQLRAQKINVLVVPGNHDINNPEAVAYNGDLATPTPTVTASEFATLYNDFGYGSALYRDAYSLSYVSAPYLTYGFWPLMTVSISKTQTSPSLAEALSRKPVNGYWIVWPKQNKKISAFLA